MSAFFTWIALMLCLAATLASSFVPLGQWNSALNLAISCTKALLIALFFMQLRRPVAVLRIAAVAGLVVLGLLFGLSWSDFATRMHAAAPWSAP